MKIRFGIIAEGQTDLRCLDNIVTGYFNDAIGERITITYLQPNLDETDNFGGWYNVLNYCQSEDFREGLTSGLLDYYIIHIDADICTTLGINLIGEEDEKRISIFIRQIEQKIITDYIGQDFYQIVATKIIFAVAVHSIECWLLPLYCKDRKKAKMLNCLTILNQQLAKINKRLLINPQKKSPRIYDKLSRPYIKQRVLKQHYAANLSLKLFVEKLFILRN